MGMELVQKPGPAVFVGPKQPAKSFREWPKVPSKKVVGLKL
jgi:hypothetical protein